MSFHWVSWEMCYVCLTCCLFQCLMFINVNISWSKARAVQTKMWHSVKPLTVGLVNQVDWSKLRGWVLRTYRSQWWETLCNILKDHSQKHRYTDFFNLPWDIEFSSCLVLFYPVNSFSLEFPVPYFFVVARTDIVTISATLALYRPYLMWHIRSRLYVVYNWLTVFTILNIQL